MKSIFPNHVTPGCTIGIVAPSGPSKPQLIKSGVNVLKKMGFETKLAANVSSETHFTAGSKELRLRETVKIFRDDAVDAVLCARGGDGAIHLLPELIHELEGVQLKPFIGYSDITLLQLALYKNFGWITYSGPMLTTEMADDSISKESRDHLWSLLMKPPHMWNLNPFSPEELTILRGGSSGGVLLGGCLSLVCAMTGSEYLPDFKDAILILEDTDETPKSIDRMLHQLRIAGIFEKINGLILGSFKGCFPGEGESDFTLAELIQSATASYDFPILMGYPYGHNIRDRLSIPIGAPVTLQTDPPALTLDPAFMGDRQ